MLSLFSHISDGRCKHSCKHSLEYINVSISNDLLAHTSLHRRANAAISSLSSQEDIAVFPVPGTKKQSDYCAVCSFSWNSLIMIGIL